MARIGEVLVSMGACDADAVREALRSQGSLGARLGTHLLRHGAVTEVQLAKVLRTIHKVPSVAGGISVSPEALDLVPRHLVEKHEAIPFGVAGERLTVLMTDPGDCRSLDDLARAAGMLVRPFVAPQARIWALMRECYGIERALPSVGLAALDDPPAGSASPFATPGGGDDGGDLMSEEVFAAIYQRV